MKFRPRKRVAKALKAPLPFSKYASGTGLTPSLAQQSVIRLCRSGNCSTVIWLAVPRRKDMKAD